MADAAKTAEKEVLEVEIGAVQDLYQALGFNTADQWDADKLLKKLKNLPAVVDKAGDLSDKLNEEQDAVLSDLLNAIEDECEIKLIDGDIEDDGEEPVAEDEADEADEAEEPVAEDEAEKKSKAKPGPKPKKDKKPAAPKADKKPSRLWVAGYILGLRHDGRSEVEASDALIEEADQEYIDKGGNPNPKEAAWAMKCGAQILNGLLEGKKSKA